ncbi:benzoate 4-monooxygenase cytochrome P450 [Aspergillus unguis]
MAFIIPLALVLVYALRVCYNLLLHPLARYPGPKLRGATRLPWFYGLITGQQHIILKQLHDEYGSVVRIAPNKLSYTSANAWRDIYGHKKAGEPEMPKDKQWYVPDPNAQQIIFSDRERHSHFRRLLSHGFSDRALRGQEPLLRKYTDLLIANLSKASKSGQPVNVVQWYNSITFDIIGDLTFGEPFGCLETGILHPWIRDMFLTIRGTLYLRLGQDLFGQYIHIVRKQFASFGAIKKREAHLNFTREKVTRRVNSDDHRPDFFEAILRQPEGKGMTFPELLSNSAILVLAGSETTATFLSGVTYLLLTNPDKLQRLTDEVRHAFRSVDEITIEKTSRLSYLQAVIEEGLRFYPPVAIALPRQVHAGGAQIDGGFVPEGTSVGVTHYAAYHSAANFEKPDEFLPERFLDPSYHDNRDVFQAFSVGPRNCIGKNLAYAEMKLILSRLVFHFDMTLNKESQGWINHETYLVWEKPPLGVHLTEVGN